MRASLTGRVAKVRATPVDCIRYCSGSFVKESDVRESDVGEEKVDQVPDTGAGLQQPEDRKVPGLVAYGGERPLVFGRAQEVATHPCGAG